MVVTFTKSVFLVLLLQAAAAETFLPLSSPSPPLPQGNSMGSPFLWPHTATELSSPRGQGVVQSLDLHICEHRANTEFLCASVFRLLVF